MSDTDTAPTPPPAGVPGTQKGDGEDIEVVSNFCRIDEIGAKRIYSYKVVIADLSAEGQAGSTGAMGAAGSALLGLPATAKREVFSKAVLDPKLKGRYVFYAGSEFAYAPKSLHKKGDGDGDQVEDIVVTVMHTLGEGELADLRRLQVRLVFQRRYETKLVKKYCSGDKSVPDTYVHEVMYVLDCLFRLHPTTKLRFMANAYVTDQHAIKTANGFDIWWGYQQTVRPGEGSLFLIIHTKPMPVVTSATLSEAALMFSRSKTVRTLADMTPKEWNSFTPVVRGLQVSIPGTPQVWLAGLSQNQAKNEQIDGVPVAKYYSDTFGVTIRNLESPCALTALGVPVPLELCRILPGQMLPRVSGRQLNQLCTHGAASPELRRRIIDIGINDLDFASNPDLQAFGIRVNPQPENFRARILPPPQLLMHRNGAKHPVQINEGRWGIGGHKVVDTTQLKSWAIVCFANKKMYPPAVVSAFASQLMKTCKEIGIDVLNVAPQIRYDTISSNIDQALSHACHLAEASSGGERAQMVLCILPSTSASLYGEIKRVATTIVGVQTQCIQAANIVAHKPKILSLIALKMNVKLGGYSTELSDGDRPCISERPTMVISADVSHATESGNMSVAAILSSVDLQCKRFQGIVLQHPKKMEFIENFDVIIRQCLRLFYKNTQQKPERIVYFRDGVGDATINKVKDLELQAIYKGCSLIDPNYRPKVTVLLVRKRHHTRFLPVEGSSKCCSQEGNGNCLPGTLVDRGAVNPTMTNFYLLSHTTKAGTARPLYYMMLHDDSGLDPQQLKTLTHNLSYTYPIVTKTATMPAPVYYAHRLTAQGRFHINQPFNSLPKFTARPGTRSSQKQRGQQQPPHLVPVHRNLQDTMYFM